MVFVTEVYREKLELLGGSKKYYTRNKITEKMLEVELKEEKMKAQGMN